jgi:hypothetical protein
MLPLSVPGLPSTPSYRSSGGHAIAEILMGPGLARVVRSFPMLASGSLLLH